MAAESPKKQTQNKPNSNPIKPNLRKAKMNVNLYVIEDYRKIDDFAVRENKPNSNPIQTQFQKGGVHGYMFGATCR